MFGGRRLAVAGLIVLLAAFTALRLDLRDRITNIDESIPIAVSYAMYSSGRLDPNWARAELTSSLKYPQYNFYTYNIASHGVLKLMKLVRVDPLVLLRFANLVYQAIAIAAVVAALWNIGASTLVLWLAASLLTVAPALVHDAHMARPESFLYMLFALATLAATLPIRLVARAALVGVLVGIGTACKVTFLATGLVLLPFLWPLSRQTLAAASVAAVATVAGFAISAPYAVINFDVLMNGMRYLFAQYTSAHPPHSLLEPSALGSIAWTIEFLLKLYGPLIPAGADPAARVGAQPAFDRTLAVGARRDRLFRAQAGAVRAQPVARNIRRRDRARRCGAAQSACARLRGHRGIADDVLVDADRARLRRFEALRCLGGDAYHRVGNGL